MAGVAASTSASPALAPHAVGLSVACIGLLTVVDLRGVKEPEADPSRPVHLLTAPGIGYRFA